MCISECLRPLHSEILQSWRQLRCQCTLLPLLHVANGALMWTKHMQWGRLLPMSGNTGLHGLSCLFSKHGSFASQPRSTISGVVFAVREGHSENDGYLHRVEKTCCLHGPDLPHLSTPSSYVLAARGNFSRESTHHWNWSHGHPKNCLCDRYCDSARHCGSSWF